MKKPSARIREEIARLQEQLKQAESREAERIGRIALKAGIGDLPIDEEDLQTAFLDLARRFRTARLAVNAWGSEAAADASAASSFTTGAAQSNIGEG
jgi:hypothetical protein